MTKTLTLEQKKEELLALLPERKAVKPAVYDKVKAQMGTLVHEYIDEVLGEAPAASTRSPTGIYQIILPSDLPDYASIPLDIHENGHCIFQHLKDTKTKHEQIKKQLRSKWGAFKAKIENDEDIDDEALLDAFGSQIENVAMDLEINSKYFGGGDDWKVQYENISVGQMVATINRMEEIPDELFEELKKELSDTEKVLESCKGMHPEYFNFPLGMNWQAYIQLMLSNPNDFMDNLNQQLDMQKMISEALKQMQQQMQQQGQQGQGQGNSQGQGQGQDQGNGGGNGQPQDGDGQKKDGDGQGNGKKSDKKSKGKDKKDGSGKGDGDKKKKDGNGNGEGKIKASVIKNAQRKQVQLSNETKEAIKKGAEAKAKAAAENGPEESDDDTWEPANTAANFGAGIGSDHGRGEAEGLETNRVLDKEVRSFIEKCCIGNAVTYEKQDPLYNYNRGKTSGGVMRMRTTIQQVYRPGNLIAVIDVSGSVDIDLVKALLKELKKYRGKFGYNSRIILWDTDLVDDIKFNEFEDKIHRGGGTEIASGIEYAKKYLKSDADKLFVISDFEDYLNRWVEIINTLKSDVFGICWGGMDGKKALLDSCRGTPSSKIQKMKVLSVN